MSEAWASGEWERLHAGPPTSLVDEKGRMRTLQTRESLCRKGFSDGLTHGQLSHIVRHETSRAAQSVSELAQQQASLRRVATLVAQGIISG